ncbi:hypothetical protein, partial [Candidatus Ichthyocystis sparus]|uniref:hypothetical protein n=1 Tax=Candidatus Ichthyocystis sparus TaxID=1561004 RepID=UPI001F5F3C79
ITFHLQGQRMLLSDFEVGGVTSVGGDNLSTKIGVIQHGGQTQNGRLSIDAEICSGRQHVQLQAVWCG